MVFKLSLINLLIILLKLYKFSYCYLIFPFKTRQIEIKGAEDNLALLLRSLIYNHIYIEIEIGEPKQTVEAFLSLESTEFYLSEKTKNDLRTNCSNPMIFDVNSSLSKFFDKNLSNSLEITNRTKSKYRENKGNISNDLMHFTSHNKEKYIKRIPFILYNSTMGNRPGVIGLQFIRAIIDQEFNLIDKLKLNDVINSYYWMINYTSNNEGNFIIGEQPHFFDPKNFKEENLLIGHPFLYSAMSPYWGLRFDEILFRGRNFRPYHECYFEYEYNYIFGIFELENELDKFFNDSIINGTCFKEKIKYSYDPHTFFYCNKDKYKKNMKYFPPIEFYHREMNYTFILDYKDLFVEKYDKLILLIFFEEYGGSWKFGKPFLKKYPFLINQESKVVGFYKREVENIETNYILVIKIIVIIIGIIILLVIGIFISKFLSENRKKRINTIDDDFDYATKEDDIENKIN